MNNHQRRHHFTTTLQTLLTTFATCVVTLLCGGLAHAETSQEGENMVLNVSEETEEDDGMPAEPTELARSRRFIGVSLAASGIPLTKEWLAPYPIPGVALAVQVHDNFSFDLTFVTLVVLNRLEAGARWWWLDAALTPTLSASVGFMHLIAIGGYGGGDLYPIGRLGFGLDYVGDSGFSAGAGVGGGAIWDQPFVDWNLRIGHRF